MTLQPAGELTLDIEALVDSAFDGRPDFFRRWRRVCEISGITPVQAERLRGWRNVTRHPRLPYVSAGSVLWALGLTVRPPFHLVELGDLGPKAMLTVNVPGLVEQHAPGMSIRELAKRAGITPMMARAFLDQQTSSLLGSWNMIALGSILACLGCRVYTPFHLKVHVQEYT